MRSPVVLALALSLSATGLPATASAAAADDANTRKKVQTYLDLAADLFKSNDHEGALVELRRAEALSDLGIVRYNIARCLEELHRDAEAVQAFEKYLKASDATPGAGDRQKRARDTIARLAEKLFGALEVTCPIEGSSVFVVELMQMPEVCPWKSEKVPAGTYEVQTFSPGFAPFVTKVTVPAGKSVLVAAQAVPAAPVVQPVAPTQPVLQPQPVVQPAQPEPQPPVVAQPEPRPQPTYFQPTQPAPTTPVYVAPTEPQVKKGGLRTGRFVGGTVLTVLGLAGLGSMTYFIYDGNERTNQIKNGTLPTGKAISDAADAGVVDNIAAVLTGLVGIGLTIPGVVLMATSGGGSEAPQASLQLSPVAHPHGAGLVLSGTLP